MSAFAQTTSGDLDISSGNLAVVSDLAQCTAWKLSNLFAFFKGEWFRDLRLGVPYFQYVLVHSPNLGVIGSVLKQVALSAPGVSSVSGVDLNYLRSSRSLSANLTIQLADGTVLQGGVGKPFIITSPGGSP